MNRNGMAVFLNEQGQTDAVDSLVLSAPYLSTPPRRKIVYSQPFHNQQRKGRLPSIFEVKDLECSRPRTKKQVNPKTGEITYVVVWRFSRELGGWIPVRCRNNSCYACAIWNARRIAGALWLTQPEWAITLTLVGETFFEIYSNVKQFTKSVRTTVPEFQYAWMAEPNPGKTGHHVLVYAHTLGSSRADLSKVVKSAWSYRHQVKRFDHSQKMTFFGYQLKMLARPDTATEFLKCNGRPPKQNLIHASHGFWRDGAAGEPINRRRAETIARERSARPSTRAFELRAL